MSIDDMIEKKDVIKALKKLHEMRKEHENDKDVLGHRMYYMMDYASNYWMKELKLTSEDIQEYDLGIYDTPQKVMYQGFEVLIPAGYPTEFYKKPGDVNEK